MDKHNKSKQSKNILLTSCGLHPQIITELIYAVSQQEPPIQFNEIHVITTEVGLEQIKTYLLDKENGYFHKLCHEYGLKDTHFQLENVQLLENAMGVSLVDIQTVADNEIVADSITDIVRQLTSDPDTNLHVSLAGGRRTISYYLGYALSLFGRPQDRLSHIIVTHDFEADDEFFYPNKTPTYITDRDGNTLNTQDAKIQLAEIPFVRLREGLPLDLLKGNSTFTETIASVPKVIQTAQVQISLRHRAIFCNDSAISLSPIQFAWYVWLLSRVKEFGDEHGSIWVRSDHHTDFINYFKQLNGNNHSSVERTELALSNGFSIDYISEKNSLVNKRIRNALGKLYPQFYISSYGERPDTKYTVCLEPENIIFKDDFVRKQ